MNDLIEYCDKIYDKLLLIDKEIDSEDGDLYIWHERDRSFYEFGEMRPDPNNITIYEEGTEGEITMECAKIIQISFEYEYIGRECERIRKTCIDRILDRFLSLKLKDRESYVSDVLKQMLYIYFNHPLAKRKTFKRVVVPDLFRELIKTFQSYRIKMDKILPTFGRYEREDLCSLLNITYQEQSNKKNQNQSVHQDFQALFNVCCQPFVSQFVERLEEERIIKNNIYICSKKNYLARLLLYMQQNDFVCPNKKITMWKCFYGYFGIDVVEKREEGINRNIVTRSNLEKGLEKNFSDQEMKDFTNFCSCFPKSKPKHP